MTDINWRDIVNGLTGPFPEVGLDAPSVEVVKKEDTELDDLGEFSRLNMVVYFWTDKETGKTYTSQRHWLVEHGEVTLREALMEIERKKKQK